MTGPEGSPVVKEQLDDDFDKMNLTEAVLFNAHILRQGIYNRLAAQKLPPIEIDQKISDEMDRTGISAMEAAALSIRFGIPQTAEKAISLLQLVSHPRFLEVARFVVGRMAQEQGIIRDKAYRAATLAMNRRHLDDATKSEAAKIFEKLKTGEPAP